jgi:hydrogenase maturation protease
MAGILVIGYGNSLRSDDGVGLRIAEELRSLTDGEAVEIVTCQQLGVEHAEAVGRSSLVFFVDACFDEAIAGNVGMRLLEASQNAGSSTHHLDPASLLGLASTLYGSEPQGMMVTVAGASSAPGEDLTPAVSAAVSVAAARICSLISIARGKRLDIC